VRGGDHNPRQTLERYNGKWDKGRGGHPGKEVDLEVIVEENGGNQLGEPLAVVPSIVANDHSLRLPLLDARIDVDQVGTYALGHLDDHHVVQGIESRPHSTPQAGG